MISRPCTLAILRASSAPAVPSRPFPQATHGYPTMRRPLLLPLCLVTIALAGCGNKGPLYMPDNPHPPVYVPPKAQPAPAATQAAPAAAASSATH